MVLNREGIYTLFEDKDIPYVFNRVKIDTSKDRARDIVKVRGSLLEEDLNLSSMDGLMLEMLIGDQFVEFYQNIINLPYDKRTPEDKLYSFSKQLYTWISKRLGFVPDWVLPDREQHLRVFIDKLLDEADDYIPDSEVLLGLLLRNTQLHTHTLFKEQLRRGVWSSTETGVVNLDVAEDDYLLGKTNTSVGSLSLYVRLAERGYRDKETLDVYVNSKGFKESVITDYDEVCGALNSFMWRYADGEKWVGFADKVYQYAKEVQLNRVSVERPNPNQIVFRDKKESNTTVNVTFSDKIEVTVRKETKIVVAYNQQYYQSSFLDINESIDKFVFRASVVIPVVQAIFRNLPMDIPTKERDIEKYNS